MNLAFWIQLERISTLKMTSCGVERYAGRRFAFGTSTCMEICWTAEQLDSKRVYNLLYCGGRIPFAPDEFFLSCVGRSPASRTAVTEPFASFNFFPSISRIAV